MVGPVMFHRHFMNVFQCILPACMLASSLSIYAWGRQLNIVWGGGAMQIIASNHLPSHLKTPTKLKQNYVWSVLCCLKAFFNRFRNSFHYLVITKLLFLLLTKMPGCNNVKVLSFKCTACKRISNVEDC